MGENCNQFCIWGNFPSQSCEGNWKVCILNCFLAPRNDELFTGRNLTNSSLFYLFLHQKTILWNWINSSFSVHCIELKRNVGKRKYLAPRVLCTSLSQSTCEKDLKWIFETWFKNFYWENPMLKYINIQVEQTIPKEEKKKNCILFGFLFMPFILLSFISTLVLHTFSASKFSNKELTQMFKSSLLCQVM